MGNAKSSKRKKTALDVVAYSSNNETTDLVACSSKSKTADGTLQLLEKRMDRMDAEVQSLRKKINALYAEQLHFEKRADEATGTYASNVQLIMLFHGLGSVFLQVNNPYAGAGVSVVMVALFFSAFMVAYMVTLNKIERMSEFEKNLQRQQMEYQNEVTYFGAKIEALCSDGELENLASKGALRRVLDSIGSLRKGAVALQEDITRIRELSNSKNIRVKSLSQVAVVAIIYGLCFPTIAYYILCLMGFRRAGPLSMMQQY
ncbi:uncharacterized protein LOC131301140 isoform X1 [Rhododendron vialii]|uniref:uncharacterized protein LOC131301140 isoform X1 n=1 Tax=Rhododendron vialii TaxID=182163 RepID=UPI00265FCCA6|nr:uncharacterized protein LOC131301140 isoform X1 [Rhododendron vialii]XP_058183298.1 uncharacterized protein LOC131301140 isoform X1 [Rhododendron vialii]